MGKKSDGALADVGGPQYATGYVPKGAAADATSDHPIFRASFACKIRKVRIVPGAAITGADTNTAYFTLYMRAADGSGTTALATRMNVSGTDSVANDAIDLYAPASALSVVQDAVLSIQRTKFGTGLAVPDLFVQVEHEAE